jgi:hypothetical protein
MFRIMVDEIGVFVSGRGSVAVNCMQPVARLQPLGRRGGDVCGVPILKFS